MTQYLVATASEKTTAAACEYLRDKLEDGDRVNVLTVDVPDESDDREAALDLAQVRLADVTEIRTFRRDGEPAREIVTFVRENDVDEIIMGPARQGGISTIGSTTRAVLSRVDKPVFVVPADPA
ncbi:universal stress protein [Natronomonas halophila]|uniref:universal stress protein n=1 Tax=Natronomonas halophila TaxID=2747817 RepID=UPI0015B5C05A|nr:universal stress protein [Natronomonas halophila]QLD84822.1 universal stress protein [Natronomonas halophila]